MSESVCLISGCAARPVGWGWCESHYRRWQRHGDPTAGRPSYTASYNGVLCSVESCERDAFARGWCLMHYKRWRNNGDPNVTRRREKGAGCINESGYLLVTAKGHPLARSGGQALEHRVVLYDSIGPGVHPCHHCGRSVSWEKSYPHDADDALVVDHLDHDRLNNELTNLVPSCDPCNRARQK